MNAEDDGARRSCGAHVLVRVERLRHQAEEFKRTVEEELRTTRALIEELRVRQAEKTARKRQRPS